jgi:LPS sulfotransferase NodH
MTPGDLQRHFERSGIRSSYSLAFSMRCGSTVLSQTLETFAVGRPTEYFQYPYDRNPYFPNTAGLPVADWFRQLVVQRQQGNTFGSKMSHDHRAHLDAHLREGLPGYVSLSDALPDHKWIFMRRRDTIAQAMSWHIAECTNRWHVASSERDVAGASVPYDFFSILSKVMIVCANNVNWEAYFARIGIEPCRIDYEDLVANPTAEIGRIFRFLGVEAKISEVVLERDGRLKPLGGIAASAYASTRDRFMDDFLRLGESGDRDRLGVSLDSWNAFFSTSGWRDDRRETARSDTARHV